MLFCNVKLVNWEEGNYNVNDYPNPRGEIHVGGENVAVGYYKKPDLTNEEFYEENGKRWFRTGDIGEISPDGRLKVIIILFPQYKMQNNNIHNTHLSLLTLDCGS